MNSRHVIADAWQFTREHKNLMWWYAFVPSLLTTLIGILYVSYQFFSFKAVFDHAEKSFLSQTTGVIFGFLNKHNDLWLPAVIVIVVVLFMYAFLPTLFQGSLIQLIARDKKGEGVKAGDGVGLGMIVFLPMLEYHLLIKTFSTISLFTEAGFVLRNLGPGALGTLLPIFILFAVIGFILLLLFTYSEFFIVLDKQPVLTAMGRSAKLVILSWQHTFLIGILMLIIGLRVIINIIAVLIVPAILFVGAGLLATFTLKTVGIYIGVGMSVIGLFVAAYFTGILNVFANAVWTYTFLELIEEKKL